MKIIFTQLLVFALCLILYNITNGQLKTIAESDRVTEPACIGFNPEQFDQADELARGKAEVRYRSPIRYVVVYNDVDHLGIRDIEIVMEPKQFSEENLTKVFCLLKERYPTPRSLVITVHTNLATIETPEERELLRDSEDSRFANYQFSYKRASFSRFEDGREAFIYTTSLSPSYKEKMVVLAEAK